MRLYDYMGGFWKRLHARPKPVHAKAKQPNKRSPITTHRTPAKKAGVGLSGLRADLHRLMLATVPNRYGWTYHEVRPLYLPKRRLTRTELASLATVKKALALLVEGYHSDCSFGAKTLYFLASAADDPTGENWGPWGNSTTTYEHLAKRPGLDNALQPKLADLAKCKVGDILLFGQNGSEHMTLVMEAGADPLLWSDGYNGAPNAYRLSDDTRRPISVCIPKGG